MASEFKSGRGGRRPGSGRPKGSTKPETKKMVSVRLPAAVVGQLRRQADREGVSQAVVIERALAQLWGRK